MTESTLEKRTQVQTLDDGSVQIVIGDRIRGRYGDLQTAALHLAGVLERLGEAEAILRDVQNFDCRLPGTTRVNVRNFNGS